MILPELSHLTFLDPIAFSPASSSLDKTSPTHRREDGLSTGSHEISVSSTMSNPEQALVNVKEQAALEERRSLGKKENQVIWCLRIVVVVVLLAMAVAVLVTVYLTIHDSEEETFENEFRFYASSVIQHFNRAVENKLNALNVLSASITTHAKKTNSTFPFVTVPDFAMKGCNSRIMGDNTAAIYTPYISEENRLEWESYSRNNIGHIYTASALEESEKRLQDMKFGLETESATDPSIPSGVEGVSPVIYFPSSSGIVSGDELQPPFFPIWHATPVLPVSATGINVDLSKLPYQSSTLDTVMETGQATISAIPHLEGGNIVADSAYSLMLQYGQYRHRHDQFSGDPLSPMVYPVFDSFGKNQTVVGTINSPLYWRFLFSNMLPEHISGIICVLENTLGQQATFQIDGLEARFVSGGDVHDSSFDYLERSIIVQEYMRDNASPDTTSFTLVELNQDYASYTLRVYPSETFKVIYVTEEAGRKTAAMGAIFVVIFLVFGTYDCCVRRRQRIVLERAVKATAVVSSLFPQNIREQVINDGHHSSKKESRKQVFLKKDESGGGRVLPDRNENCTVTFLDLDGFTQWSSTRDSLAQRRGVFKVETIGHNYMAVTGLPKAQDDHAVRMAKFASDCLLSFDQLAVNLLDSLGEGTGDLSLKIGMHSGEITSGVFRGDKSRFQLVGDTVNTASRMQSTGVAGRIQCSQSTADALLMAGKGGWVKARMVKVVAKGKGELQTYFIRAQDKGNKSQGTTETGAVSTTT